MKNYNITLEEPGHRYMVDGVHKPGNITAIISDYLHGGVKSAYFTEQTADRGHIVHELLALDIMGRLKESSIDERLAGYLTSGRLLIKKLQLRPVLVEKKFYDATNDTVGQIDLLATSIFYPGKIILGDWKTGVAIHPDWDIQLCGGYAHGLTWVNGLLQPKHLLTDIVPLDFKLHKDGKCASVVTCTDFEKHYSAWPKIAADWHASKR